ncbi:MAG TPA: pimeloyl-ACP methyl ester esterase BioH [Arenimonas sp.]|nr:pimeloyl-ACP methyl ester esterase BioH [Arenimonas sp.]
MHIETTGTGPALVLLHGWAMHGGLFAPLIERLRHDFTVHAVDLPGHGHSRDSATPLQLDAIVDALATRLPSAIWAGWSMGGLVALHAAARQPAQVRGLVMLAASPRFVRDHDWPAGMEAAVFRGFARELALDYRETLDRFLMLEAQGAEQQREKLRVLREQIFARGEPGEATLLAGLALLDSSDLRATLPQLACPSLWLAGRRDRLVSPLAMQAAAALAPAAQFVEFGSGGHAPFITHPGEVAEALVAFSERLP